MDIVKVDMQIAGMTEEDGRERVRQMIHLGNPIKELKERRRHKYM